MKMQIQPNSASCFITALAMCIDVPVEELFKILSHDGTERAFPFQPPKCYRGFHPSELAYCAYMYGYSFTEFVSYMQIGHDDKRIRTYLPPYKIADLLNQFKNAVIIDDRHAWAWDGKMMFNPNGKITEYKGGKINTIYSVIML